MWVENWKEVVDKWQIDTKLNKLQEQINSIPFEKKENWLFNLKLNNIVLDIDLTAEKLVEAYRYLKSRLIIANSNYIKNSPAIFVKGFFSWNWNLDIDWRIDPKYMIEDRVINIFWDNMDKVIKFLNDVLSTKRDKNKNNDFIDWMFDSWKVNLIESFDLFREIENDNRELDELSQLQIGPDRKESLIRLKNFLKNWIGWDSTETIWYFKSIMWDNIVFEEGNSFIRNEQRVFFELSNDWSYINITQQERKLWRYIIKDYNDQVILLLLSWKKTIDDYEI